MGMSADMAPRYVSMNQSGQMTYVIDAGNLNLGQVQLAVPASEILLIDESKSINLCDNSVLVTAEVPAENVSWLGNNVIVLVSQPQEYVVVEQEVIVDSNVAQPWAGENGLVAKEIHVDEIEEEPATTVEDAKNWFRDSLISTAALSTLTTYVESNNSQASTATKVG